MSLAGWIMMTLSVGSVLGLTVFCLYRVLNLPPAELEELMPHSEKMDE